MTKKTNLLLTDLLLNQGFIKKLIDSLPGIFYLYQVTKDDFKLIGWNKNFETAFGYSASELVNKSVRDFFTSKEFFRVGKGLKKVLEIGKWQVKAEVITKNGKSIPYFFEGYKFEYDKLLYFFGVGIDISSEYRLQSNLKTIKKEIEKADEIIHKKERELLANAMQISENNEVVDLVKKKIKTLLTKDEEIITRKDLKDLENDLESKFIKQNNWEIFKTSFSQVHPNFISNLLKIHPTLTKTEIKFCTYIKINMSSDQIRSLLNISKEGIKKSRYRIRKKMNLLRDESLENAITKI